MIGEVLEEDEISRTGTIDDIWSRILFEDDNGEEQVGYIQPLFWRGMKIRIR